MAREAPDHEVMDAVEFVLILMFAVGVSGFVCGWF